MNSGRSGGDSAVLCSSRDNRGGERRPVRFTICRGLVNRAGSLDHWASVCFVLERNFKHTWVYVDTEVTGVVT